MMSKFGAMALLALVACGPAHEAVAQDSLGGAIVGGVLGGVVGGAVGGGRGAAIGAIVGAGTGAAIAAQGEPRPGGYYYYQNGCYVQQPDGGWYAVSPRYCGTVQYPAPRVEYYGAPACTQYRSYDPRSGTFIGRDGYRRPCP